MHTLKVSQSGRNLFEIVKGKLKEFGININQVFAITTDNGKNLLHMSKLIKDELSEQRNDSDADSHDENENDVHLNFESQEGIASDENFYDPDIFNEEYTHLMQEANTTSVICMLRMFDNLRDSSNVNSQKS